jgi:putative exporter of polyketide antibiotics
MLNMSPLTHVGNPPDGDIDTTALAWLALLAVVLAATALAGFRQRRIPQG